MPDEIDTLENPIRRVSRLARKPSGPSTHDPATTIQAANGT
jgi:hypothetical protein